MSTEELTEVGLTSVSFCLGLPANRGPNRGRFDLGPRSVCKSVNRGEHRGQGFGPTSDRGSGRCRVDSSSFYHRFVTALRADWDVVDEGELEDLLSMQVRRNPDKSITVHMTKYIEKLLALYLPNGVSSLLSLSLSFALPLRELILLVIS